VRVLHFIPSFVGGGAEQQLVRLAGALTAAGADVHVAHLKGGPQLEHAAASGATLHRLVVGSSYDPRALTQLHALVRSLMPAVLQTWLLHADVVGGLIARRSGVPWVLAERSSAAMYKLGLKFRLRAGIGKGADAIVANSAGGAAYWHEAGYRGRLCVIGNIVAAPKALSPQGSLATDIVAVGRLSDEKNYLLLLQALEHLCSSRPAPRVDLLGSGPLQTQLQASIDASAKLAGRVVLRGHVADVPARLAAARMFVSLSRFEGTPNAVLEAVAADCPLVLSDIPAHRETVGNDGAIFVAADNAHAVAAGIAAVLDDPAAGLDRTRRARARLGDATAERVALAYLNLYQSLAVSPRSASCAS
jgi:glycosyltransferase involved in cell wall biosynthesis